MRRQRLNKIIGSNVDIYLGVRSINSSSFMTEQPQESQRAAYYMQYPGWSVNQSCHTNGKFKPTINIWNKCKYIFGNFINRRYIGVMAESLSWRNVDRMQPCIVSNKVPGSTFWHGRQRMEQPLAVFEFLGKCKYLASKWKLNKVFKKCVSWNLASLLILNLI